jgi:HEAT repeat protein
MLPALVPDLGADETFAILIYAELAHDDGLAAFARERSGLFGRRRGRGADAFAAARAIEALSLQQPEAVLSQVLDAANGRELDARRGALNALGELAGALEPLMTACEGEHDPLARGYALLAIGRHGGEAARAFLVRELERGQAAMRPWCALALGVLAEGGDDALARAALRDAHAKEKVRTSRAAYLLAFGIARDVDAEGILRDALAAKDTSTRFYAAQGLGLLRTTRGREALRAALLNEETPLVRTALAQALALQGNALDVEVLLGELDRAKNPLLRGQIAAALGLFGQRQAVDGLLARLDGQSLAADSRAAALGALAIGLSGRDRITLGGASAWSDHAAFPGWLIELLQQPM